MMQDKEITCKDCGKAFIFTQGEQVFYAEKKFDDPIRCPECRRARKVKKNNNNQAYQNTP